MILLLTWSYSCNFTYQLNGSFCLKSLPGNKQWKWFIVVTDKSHKQVNNIKSLRSSWYNRIVVEWRRAEGKQWRTAQYRDIPMLDTDKRVCWPEQSEGRRGSNVVAGGALMKPGNWWKMPDSARGSVRDRLIWRHNIVTSSALSAVLYGFVLVTGGHRQQLLVYLCDPGILRIFFNNRLSVYMVVSLMVEHKMYKNRVFYLVVKLSEEQDGLKGSDYCA